MARPIIEAIAQVDFLPRLERIEPIISAEMRAQVAIILSAMYPA